MPYIGTSRINEQGSPELSHEISATNDQGETASIATTYSAVHPLKAHHKRLKSYRADLSLISELADRLFLYRGRGLGEEVKRLGCIFEDSLAELSKVVQSEIEKTSEEIRERTLK